jgi:hypothetical protein
LPPRAVSYSPFPSLQDDDLFRAEEEEFMRRRAEVRKQAEAASSNMGERDRLREEGRR